MTRKEHYEEKCKEFLRLIKLDENTPICVKIWSEEQSKWTRKISAEVGEKLLAL